MMSLASKKYWKMDIRERQYFLFHIKYKKCLMKILQFFTIHVNIAPDIDIFSSTYKNLI